MDMKLMKLSLIVGLAASCGGMLAMDKIREEKITSTKNAWNKAVKQVKDDQAAIEEQLEKHNWVKKNKTIATLADKRRRSDVRCVRAGWTTVGLGALTLGSVCLDIMKKRPSWTTGIFVGATLASGLVTWHKNTKRCDLRESCKNDLLVNIKDKQENRSDNFKNSYAVVNGLVLKNEVGDDELHTIVQPSPRFNVDATLKKDLADISTAMTNLNQITTALPLWKLMLGKRDYSEKDNLGCLHACLPVDTDKQNKHDYMLSEGKLNDDKGSVILEGATQAGTNFWAVRTEKALKWYNKYPQTVKTNK